MKIVPSLTVLGAAIVASPSAMAQWGQTGPASQPSGYGSHGQQQTEPSLQAGGLTPPSSGAGSSVQQPPTATEQKLEKADREDSGRGLEFIWLNAEVGFTHLGLQTFKANHLVDAGVVKTTDSGLAYGGGLGLRLVFITVGARFRLANLSEYQLWTLNGELGIRIPLGDIEPYFTFGAGYASMGSFSRDNVGSGLNSSDVSITGYDIRGGFGLDYYLTPVFSVGASLTGEMMGLSRPGVNPSKLRGSGAAGAGSADSVYAADGSSIGAGVTVTGVLGLHF